MLDPDFLSYHLDLSPQVHTNIGYRGLSIGVSHPTLIPHVGSEKGGPPLMDGATNVFHFSLSI